MAVKERDESPVRVKKINPVVQEPNFGSNTHRKCVH